MRTLILKATTNGLQYCIPHICRLVDNMEVLSTSLADDPGITFVLV